MEKKLHVSGPTQFQPVLLKGQTVVTSVKDVYKASLFAKLCSRE